MKDPPRAVACRLSAKDGSAWIPSPPRRWYPRQRYDSAKSILAPHPEQIRTSRHRALYGKAPCPTARIFSPVPPADNRQASERFQYPARVAHVRSLRRCREFSAPATAQEIAALVPRRPTALRAVSPARWQLL